jgi:hypothetical protein
LLLSYEFGSYIKAAEDVKLVEIVLLEGLETICSEHRLVAILGLVESSLSISLFNEILKLTVVKLPCNNPLILLQS